MVSLNADSAWSGLFFMSSEYVRAQYDDFVYPNARITAQFSRFEVEVRFSCVLAGITGHDVPLIAS
jgi:hypothetical protein